MRAPLWTMTSESSDVLVAAETAKSLYWKTCFHPLKEKSLVYYCIVRAVEERDSMQMKEKEGGHDGTGDKVKGVGLGPEEGGRD